VADYNKPNRIISGSRDKTIIIWDLDSKSIEKKTSLSCETVCITRGKMVRRLRGHNHFISDIDVSSNGDYVLSASWDGLLRLWNIKTGQSVRKFIGHKKDILSVQFNTDNRRIISCGRDKSIYLWNTIGEIKQDINNAHAGWITCVAFSPNAEDDLFVSVSYDKTVCVWQNQADGNGYKLKYKLCGSGHKSCITSLSISPDGSLCATGDKYGVLCLWDIDSGKLLSRICASSGGLQINCIVFSPNRYWACFAIGNAIEIWDLETKSNVATLKEESQSLFDSFKTRNIENNCNCITWSRDGKTLYAGYCNNKIKIWKLISPFDGLDGVHDNNMDAEYKPEQDES
jgi:guanine nucleotide-binding protein subunit beta-2-like 1 protein